MKAKKLLCVLLTLALLAALFTGCGASGGRSEKKSVVVTIFPIYDWVLQLLGDRASEWDVTFLLDNGVDLHSYQPTADDMVRVASCDLFVYVGGVSDNWVKDAMKNGMKGKTIDLMALLGDAAKEEELVEGMEPEEEEAEEEEGVEYDEHVWLSLRNAALFCTEIVKTLCEIDPTNAADYQKNADAYVASLNALDAEYAETVENAARRTVLFGDRFPFRYLTDDYGLTYYAAFLGCSAESEASFETVIFLAGKMDELGLESVLALEGTDHSLANTILQNTAAKSGNILVMNSMQSTTRADAEAGESYLGIMELNLDALRTALN